MIGRFYFVQDLGNKIESRDGELFFIDQKGGREIRLFQKGVKYSISKTGRETTFSEQDVDV